MLSRPIRTCYSNPDALRALADGTLLLACTPDLYRSVDRGATWTHTGQRSWGGLTQTPAGAVFLVRTDRSIARSLDSGVTWEPVGQAVSPTTGLLEAGADGVLYHAVETPTGAGVVRSADGASWEWVYSDGGGRPSALLPPVEASPFLYLSQSGPGTIRVDLSTGAAVPISGGAGWAPEANLMASAGAWTVFTSWRSYRPDLYWTRDRGASWAVVARPPGSEHVYALLTLDDGTILAGEGNTVSRTADGGQTWTAATLPPVNGYTLNTTTLTRTRTGALLAGADESNGMATWGIVFRSDDGGQSWTRSGSQQAVGPVVAVVEGDGGALFAGHRQGGPEGAGGALMRSDDDGRTWTLVREGSVDAIAPIDGGRFLIVTIGEDGTYRLARASETGAAWELLGPAAGRPDGMIRAADGAVYLFGAGIQRTADGGDTWQTVTDGLPDGRVSVLTQDAEGFLYAGTPLGVARSARTAVADAPGPAPIVPMLSRPFPNPARGSATLAFTLSDGGDVDLGLYDVLGRRVATLAQGAFGPGRHAAAWDASSVPPGLYLAVLHTPGGVATQPVTAIR